MSSQASERLRRVESELASTRRALDAAVRLAVQAQKDLRTSELARSAAERRAQRAEARLTDITARLAAVEHLTVLDKSEWERVEFAQTALAAAREWRRSLESQCARTLRLVRRTGELPQVRVNPHLLKKLHELRGKDFREHVKVVGQVLEGALGRKAMGEAVLLDDPFHADLELLGRSLRSLENVVELYEALGIQEAVLAPAADGTIVRRAEDGPASMVEIHDSVGVVRGDNSDVTVIHLCEVDQPVVEIAELMEIDADGPVFAWSSSTFNPGRVTDGTTSATSNALSVDLWTNICNSNGVAVGDNITMQITRHHRIEGCRVNLRELLRNEEVRNDLAASRGDSPEAEAAQERLPDTVARAVDRADLNNLVPIPDIVKRASEGRRPQARQRGPRLVIVHGVGVGIGRNPEVRAETRTHLSRVRVE